MTEVSLNKFKKHQRAIAVIIIFAASGMFGLAVFVGAQYSTGGEPEETVVVPQYETILPVDKSIEKLGGWRRVSPPKSEPVFAFSDKLDGVHIDVSQQPLPDSFKSDPAGKISDLAESYAANEKITAGDTTIYVGTSTKGPQSAILTKFDLLILIKSQKKIDSNKWAEYVYKLNSISDSRVPKF